MVSAWHPRRPQCSEQLTLAGDKDHPGAALVDVLVL
jgi:hypothetical protein